MAGRSSTEHSPIKQSFIFDSSNSQNIHLHKYLFGSDLLFYLAFTNQDYVYGHKHYKLCQLFVTQSLRGRWGPKGN